MWWLLVIWNLLCIGHDFHVSRTELSYNKKDGIIETTIHIFIDDLELAIGGTEEIPFYLGTEKEVGQADSLIINYLREHIGLFANDQLLEWQWLGKELSDDLSAFWIYLYVEWDGKGDVDIVNRILISTYDDQRNIVEYYSKGERVNTLLLDASEIEGRITSEE